MKTKKIQAKKTGGLKVKTLVKAGGFTIGNHNRTLAA